MESPKAVKRFRYTDRIILAQFAKNIVLDDLNVVPDDLSGILVAIKNHIHKLVKEKFPEDFIKYTPDFSFFATKDEVQNLLTHLYRNSKMKEIFRYNVSKDTFSKKIKRDLEL